MHYSDITFFRTQKARGLAEILCGIEATILWPGIKTSAISEAAVWPHQYYQSDLPAFARPCPTVPRHGFLDSRPVRKLADVLEVIAQTLAADPNGEVIFMPIIPAQVSGVINNGGLAIGPGNDGATAGYSSYTIPAPVSLSVWNGWWKPGPYGCERGYVWSIKDTVYAEWVSASKETSEIVQCRDGPPAPATENYIPREVTVTRVEQAHGDLLDWEQKVKEWTDIPGLVVHHPEGSLSSHYAVHCILHNIPVFVTFCPETGREYKPEEEPPDWTAADFKRFSEVLRAARALMAENNSEEAWIAVAALHGGVRWAPAPHLVEIMAVGAVFAARYIVSACAGEDRNFWHYGPGRHDPHVERDGSAEHMYRHTGQENYKKNHSNRAQYRSTLGCLLATANRNVVYEKAFDWRWSELVPRLGSMMIDFDGSWRGGYGGEAWINVVDAARELILSINKMVANPTAESFKSLIAAWNIAINTAHNGGKVMTKWILNQEMSGLSKAPVFGFTNDSTFRICNGKIWTNTNSRLGE